MAKFTVEQIKKLNESIYVEAVNENQVIFTEEFKRMVLQEWKGGAGPVFIFEKYGIGYRVLGKSRVDHNMRRWKMQESRDEGFQRVKGSGRPKSPSFASAEEEVKHLRDQLEYQRQEIEFLKKLRALEEKFQRKKNSK